MIFPPRMSFTLLALAMFLQLPTNICSFYDDSAQGRRVLNEFISYYEPIVFEEPFKPQATDDHQASGDAGQGPIVPTPLLIEVNAFGRTYQLDLKPSSRMLSKTANISVLGGSQQCEARRLSTSDIGQHLVEGVVFGEPTSYVHGTFRKGVFTGIIRSENQTIFIEKASKYFNEKVTFDCVVFRLEDLNTTAFDCTTASEGFKCDPIKLLQRLGPMSDGVLPIVNSLDSLPTFRERIMHSRPWFRRNSPKNTCRLKLVADHLFFENAGDQAIDNAIYEMIFHVNEADRIFRSTDFNGDGVPDDIGFQVHAIDVYTNTQCQENPVLSKSTLSSDQYLELFSEKDFHEFCVGVAFSGHTFPGRVLGIAWMADANSGGYVGGICEPRLYSTQDQKALSFNTAVITMMLEGRKVPRGISAIAVAHELGHSFGSDHDPYQDPICSPGREGGGKYIMAAYAVKGDQPNNRLFSQCSKKSIRNVLRKKSTCFIGASTLCADLREEVETCDCADTEHCPTLDLCCSPGGENKCVLHQEECSTDNIHSKECVRPPDCSGEDNKCIPQGHLPDGTACHMGRGVCVNGQCIIDPCLENSWEPCECPNLEDACIVCCKMSENAKCVPARRDEVPWLMLRRPGEPCDNGMGICNSHGRCERLDESHNLHEHRLWKEKANIKTDGGDGRGRKEDPESSSGDGNSIPREALNVKGRDRKTGVKTSDRLKLKRKDEGKTETGSSSNEGVLLSVHPGELPVVREDIAASPEGEPPLKGAFFRLLWMLVAILAVMVGYLLFMFFCPLSSISRWCHERHWKKTTACGIPTVYDHLKESEESETYRPMRHTSNLHLSHPRYRCDPPSTEDGDLQSRSRSY